VNLFADRLALFVLGVLAVIAAATFRDYGLGWDDYTHSEYGDLLLAFYGSGFSDQRALSFVNLYKYGGGFDMAAALAAKVLPFGLFETRRLVGAVVGIVGLITTWRIGRRVGGPVAGLVALLLLATCPLYYGHMFMNAKDAPFAAAMAVMLLAVVRAFDEYPRPSAATVGLLSGGFGLAFGSRILAGIAAPCALAGLVVILVGEGRALGIKQASARLGTFVFRSFPALVVGYVIMGLLWPWSVLAPLNPIRAAEYFDTFFEKPWREMYAGKLLAVTQMPASYLPHLFVLKLPEIMLALGLAGTVGALIILGSGKSPLPRRANLFLVIASAFMPVIVAMLTHPALYNGLRHFVFVVPPFAVLGGLAGAWMLCRAKTIGSWAVAASTAVLVGGMILPVSDMVRLHPYQYTAFNWASGGVRMAHDRYMLDYWGLAFKQASEALKVKLNEMGLKRPAGRRWTVEICGPQRPAEVALGPDFETTWDRKRADFAMMLGTFYCRDLTAPVLVEIEREGVDYARVYDIRGRPVPKLLTEPPP
jgi:hypothetical protein